MLFVACAEVQKCDKGKALPKATNEVSELTNFAQLDQVEESSGIVKSKIHEDILWTHNDSGHEAEIYPFDLKQLKDLPPIAIQGAENRDWEDLTIHNGKIYIADLGNNFNNRLDLKIISFPEPKNVKNEKVFEFNEHPISYPDYHLRSSQKNFDCEALFFFKNKLYLMTKHRSDTCTKIYRFDNELSEKKSNIPTLIDHVNIHNRVSSASISPDQKSLLVLTYEAIYLFTDFENDKFFEGKISALTIDADQCEAITFIDNESFIITNEQKEIFQLKTKDLPQVK